jgi:hypothetical protein
MLPFHTSGLHHELLLKKNMLVELCASNYATSDGLVNGVNVTFQDYIENNPKPLIWIHFYDPHINTRIKNSHIYEQFPTIDKKWTLIEQKIAKIQIGSNPSHIIKNSIFHPINYNTHYSSNTRLNF